MEAFTCVAASLKLMILPLRRKAGRSETQNTQPPQRDSPLCSVFITSSFHACVSETHSFCLMDARQRSILRIPTDVLSVRAAAARFSPAPVAASARFSPAPVAASARGLIRRVGGSDQQQKGS